MPAMMLPVVLDGMVLGLTTADQYKSPGELKYCPNPSVEYSWLYGVGEVAVVRERTLEPKLSGMAGTPPTPIYDGRGEELASLVGRRLSWLVPVPRVAQYVPCMLK